METNNRVGRGDGGGARSIACHCRWKDAPPLPKRVSKRVSSDSAPPPLPPRTPVHTPGAPHGPETCQDEEVFYDAVQSPARSCSPGVSRDAVAQRKVMKGKTWGDRLNAASAHRRRHQRARPRAAAAASPPKPAAAASGDPASQVRKMLAMKLPQGAVEQKMRADGVDPRYCSRTRTAPSRRLPKPRKKTVHLKLHAGGDLMAQLKAGTKLKKVESRAVGAAAPKAMSSGDGASGIPEPSPPRKTAGEGAAHLP